jgi:dipeptidyl aminopeptidase/acylaminoacyl peptidase
MSLLILRSVYASAAVLLCCQPAWSGSAAGGEQAGRAAEPQRPGIERFMKIRAPGSPTLASDGTLYAIDWPDGIDQLYRRRPGAGVDAPMERLSDFPDGASGYSLSPDERVLIVSAAVGGNEQDDLYRLDLQSARLEPIVANPDVVDELQDWLPDSSGFIYTANDRSPADFYIYRYDLATGQSTPLLEREGSWSVVDVSGDGRRVLAARYISASHAEAYELELATGRLTSLDLQAGVYNWPAGYLPGEDRAIIICDMEEGIARLFVRDLRSGQWTKPLPELDPYPIDGSAMNPQRTLTAVTFNEGGYSTMRLYDPSSFRAIPLPPIEKGMVGSVDIRGETLTWTLSNTRNPGLAYSWRPGERTPRQLTVADEQGIDLSRFTLPQLVAYRSFDGREIPAFLFTPPGHKAGTPISFVVNYHGGPEGQHRPGFNRTVQYLLSEGFGVMQPNVPASPRCWEWRRWCSCRGRARSFTADWGAWWWGGSWSRRSSRFCWCRCS